MTSETNNQHRVVIIGGGFGGLYAAKELGDANIKLTLIDRRNFHLFQPLLYQVATGGLSPGDIASPLRAVLNKQKNTKVYKSEVIDIDTKSKEIVLRYRTIPYDTLIVASGSSHHYYGNEHWAFHAPGLLFTGPCAQVAIVCLSRDCWCRRVTLFSSRATYTTVE